jgi:hypothetical protein
MNGMQYSDPNAAARHGAHSKYAEGDGNNGVGQ